MRGKKAYPYSQTAENQTYRNSYALAISIWQEKEINNTDYKGNETIFFADDMTV